MPAPSLCATFIVTVPSVAPAGIGVPLENPESVADALPIPAVYDTVSVMPSRVGVAVPVPVWATEYDTVAPLILSGVSRQLVLTSLNVWDTGLVLLAVDFVTLSEQAVPVPPPPGLIVIVGALTRPRRALVFPSLCATVNDTVMFVALAGTAPP